MSPVRVTSDQLDEKKQELEAMEHQYLRERGWDYRCDTPGSYWLWHKQFGERRLVMNTGQAIAMQREMDVN